MKKKDFIVASIFLVFLIVSVIILVNLLVKNKTHEEPENISVISVSAEAKEQEIQASSTEQEATKSISVSVEELEAKEDETLPIEDEKETAPTIAKIEPQTNNKPTTSTKISYTPKKEITKGIASGALSVSGANLVNSNGEIVQLKGLSTHGLAWFPDYVNKNLFKEFKETWNANIIRLAMYTEEYGGYCSGGDKNNLLNLIDNGVTYATDLDMYVIIDWHILSDGNPNKNKSEAINFFDYVSEKYKDNTHVIYEICNEPNGGTSWSDIKSYALEVIPVIRSHSPNAIIIVGTPTWSQEVDKAANNPINEYDNIMYALHFYADTHKDGLRKTMESAIKSGLPIFVTEYGICDASGSGAINESEALKWMALLDKYSISSCAWNISNKSETSAIFSSSCNKKYGFSESDLSSSGKWVFKMLTGKSNYDSSNISFEETATPPQTSSTPNYQPQNENTASKTVSNQSGPVNISLVSVSSWESDGKSFTQYNVTVTNANSYDIDSWSGDVSFDSNIELSQGWCANYTVNGNVLYLSNADFNGYIKAGESTKDIGCIIIE